jgi:hypothetical protein
MNNAALIGAVTLMVLAAILWPKGRSNRTPNVSTMAKISRARSPVSHSRNPAMRFRVNLISDLLHGFHFGWRQQRFPFD